MSIRTQTVMHEGITMRIHTQNGEPINWVADTVNGPVLIPAHMQPTIQALINPGYRGTCWCCSFRMEADIPEASCPQCGELAMEWC